MRVGIYLGRHASSASGMAVYCRALIQNMPEILNRSGDDELVIYGDRSILDDELLKEFENSPCLTAILPYGPGSRGQKYFARFPNGRKLRILVRVLPRLWRHQAAMLFDQVCMPLYACWDDLDVIHSTTNYGLMLARSLQVITVHDLFQAFPQYLSGEKQAAHDDRIIPKLYQRLFAWQFAGANKVITDTKLVAEEIGKRYCFDRGKLATIPLGLDSYLESYLQLTEEKRKELAQIWAKAKNLTSGYVLIFASNDPRKNTERMIKAWLSLPERQRSLPLVIVGGRGSIMAKIKELFAAAAKEAAKKGEAGEMIKAELPAPIFLNNVPREEMALLLVNGAILLNVTAAEGFGLPAYEAVALGCKVITERLESLNDLPQQELFYAEPSSEESISQALKSAISEVVKRGANRSSLSGEVVRSMKKTAEDTYQIYRQVSFARRPKTLG
ncbi:MAG: glycosyltransferase [Deltaproteobacteria bacterium]|nr:glycosyltransferase [Deltaproteobacteria bacterium]